MRGKEPVAAGAAAPRDEALGGMKRIGLVVPVGGAGIMVSTLGAGDTGWIWLGHVRGLPWVIQGAYS